MKQIRKRIPSFSKRASSVEHKRKIICTVTRDEFTLLDNKIDSKIKQNKQERAASMRAAARCIVGRK